MGALFAPANGMGPETLIGASSGTSLRTSGKRRRLAGAACCRGFHGGRLVVGHPPRFARWVPGTRRVGFAATAAVFSDRAGDRRAG